jgi:hypothetical protein
MVDPIPIYVSKSEAKDSEGARLRAWAVLQDWEGQEAPQKYRVSSVMWNRSRGGWTVCFRERPKCQKCGTQKNLIRVDRATDRYLCDSCQRADFFKRSFTQGG